MAATPVPNPLGLPHLQSVGSPLDIEEWNRRFVTVMNSNGLSDIPIVGEEPNPYENSLWHCLTPVSTCLISFFAPCVLFGRTYHRMQHLGDMTTYGPCNLFCCGQYCLCEIGLHCILPCVQETEIRKRYNLKGNLAVDCLKHYFCPCCALIQAEKEVEFREAKRRTMPLEQYRNLATMVAEPQVPPIPTLERQGRLGEGAGAQANEGRAGARQETGVVEEADVPQTHGAADVKETRVSPSPPRIRLSEFALSGLDPYAKSCTASLEAFTAS